MTRRSPGSRLVGALLIAGVWVYRGTLGLLIQVGIGPVCRFEPSCSQYMIEAIRLYGPVDGVRRGLRRLARCHPWHEGGYDPP